MTCQPVCLGHSIDGLQIEANFERYGKLVEKKQQLVRDSIRQINEAKERAKEERDTGIDRDAYVIESQHTYKAEAHV